jgi:hypothetical protein
VRSILPSSTPATSRIVSNSAGSSNRPPTGSLAPHTPSCGGQRSPLPSRVEGRSVASRTSWPAGLANSNAGTPFPTNANEAVPEHGSPQPATRPTGPNGTRQAEICRNSPGATPTDGSHPVSSDRPYWQVKGYVEAMGLEPTNLLTASQALYQLSYAPGAGDHVTSRRRRGREGALPHQKPSAWDGVGYAVTMELSTGERRAVTTRWRPPTDGGPGRRKAATSTSWWR